MCVADISVSWRRCILIWNGVACVITLLLSNCTHKEYIRLDCPLSSTKNVDAWTGGKGSLFACHSLSSNGGRPSWTGEKSYQPLRMSQSGSVRDILSGAHPLGGWGAEEAWAHRDSTIPANAPSLLSPLLKSGARASLKANERHAPRTHGAACLAAGRPCTGPELELGLWKHPAACPCRVSTQCADPESPRLPHPTPVSDSLCSVTPLFTSYIST